MLAFQTKGCRRMEPLAMSLLRPQIRLELK